MINFNRGWKFGKYFKVRRFDTNLISLFTPWYAMSQLRQPCAIIFNGRQIIIKKVPKDSEYFIDKTLGLFHLDRTKSYYFNGCDVYMFDSESAQPLQPQVLEELWKWANHNQLYKIRRVDVDHAAKLRTSDKKETAETLAAEQKDNRDYMSDLRKNVAAENKKKRGKLQEEGGDPLSPEYREIPEEEVRFIIVDMLSNTGRITTQEATELNDKLKQGLIRNTDELIHEVGQLREMLVKEPITIQMERILDDYHTYRPRDILMYIQTLSKIRKGIKRLKTKMVVNWFPSMYILFACVGIAVVYMIYQQYSGEIDLGGSGLIPGLNLGG